MWAYELVPAGPSQARNDAHKCRAPWNDTMARDPISQFRMRVFAKYGQRQGRLKLSPLCLTPLVSQQHVCVLLNFAPYLAASHGTRQGRNRIINHQPPPSTRLTTAKGPVSLLSLSLSPLFKLEMTPHPSPNNPHKYAQTHQHINSHGTISTTRPAKSHRLLTHPRSDNPRNRFSISHPRLQNL